MENLTINNFLVIKEASLDVKKFNIIIGSQGTGKSVLAKTLYFFKSFENRLRRHLAKADTFEQFSDSFKNRFISIFPVYAWENQSFSINYKFNQTVIKIYNKKNVLIIDFDEKIKTAYSRSLQRIQLIVEKIESNGSTNPKFSIPPEFLYRNQINEILDNSALSLFRIDANFIPASRSFFSLFQENFFNIISNTNNLDPLLLDFGRIYEVYISAFFRNQDHASEYLPTAWIKEILGGEIEQIDDRYYLVNNKQRTEFIHTSSGQQEALPMLVSLAVLAYIENESDIFIEEPEAHLFPSSQAKIVKILSHMYAKKFNLFITTHSPYILSELNNYLYANDLIKRNLMSIDEYNSILPLTSPINIDDVNAYKMEDGFLKSIIDIDYSMINSEELDKASSHASEIYNQLLEFEAQD